MESVLCNFLTKLNVEMEPKRINAVDVSFGSSGFKMLIAAMYDCKQVRVYAELHACVVW